MDYFVLRQRTGIVDLSCDSQTAIVFPALIGDFFPLACKMFLLAKKKRTGLQFLKNLLCFLSIASIFFQY